MWILFWIFTVIGIVPWAMIYKAVGGADVTTVIVLTIIQGTGLLLQIITGVITTKNS